MTEAEGIFVKLPIARIALSSYCSVFDRRGLELIAKENVGESMRPINPAAEIRITYKSQLIENFIYIIGQPMMVGNYKGYDITIEGLPPFAKLPAEVQEKVKSLSKG